MNTFRLALRSVCYYWRTTVALTLGVVVATAVIGGAIVVGDSVRDSLADMTLQRLGKVQLALHSPRFIREQVAADLTAAARNRSLGNRLRTAPAILLDGSLEAGEATSIRRVTNANVVGLTDRMWNMLNHGSAQVPGERQVVLGARVARELNAGVGDQLRLWVEIPESVPRETLLGERDEISQEISVTVSDVLSETDGASRFDLRPTQQLPATVFVDLHFLQEQLGLDEVQPSRRRPLGAPARINALMFALAERNIDGVFPSPPAGEEPEFYVDNIHRDIESRLTYFLLPADVGLRVRPSSDRGYIAFESDSLVLDPPSAAAVDAFTDQLLQGTPGSARALVDWAQPWLDKAGRALPDKPLMQGSPNPVFVYLANQLANAQDDRGGEQNATRNYSSYSVVAGIKLTNQPPFGPFEFLGAPVTKLQDDEILINEWLAEDTQLQVGDDLRIRYYLVGSEGQGAGGGLVEADVVFRVAGIVRLGETPAADPDFTPWVPGITDADSISDWEQPFDMQMDRITERDDAYWERYKTTPKAFVSLSRAQELWASRHGNITSVRAAVVDGAEPEEVADIARRMPLLRPSPAEFGLRVRSVRKEGLQAAVGANDFTGLFIGFSFFLIGAAAILIALLFRLSIDQRSSQVGLLLAVGLTEQRMRQVFLTEGLVIVLLGLVPGLAAAVGYAALMMYGLRTWWIGATGTRFLHLSVHASSLAMTAAVSAVVSLAVVWFSVRRLRGISARRLLTGDVDSRSLDRDESGRRPAVIAAAVTLGSLALVAATRSGMVPSSEAFGGLGWDVVAFFVAGIGLLAGGIFGISFLLQARKVARIRRGKDAIVRLAIRNAQRHKARSLSTIGLLAFATFVIVAVAAGRRNPAAEAPDLHSGNGGFSLVAEASVPLLFDLNTAEGRRKLGIPADIPWPDGVVVHSFRMHEGEDASCLNLYQTRVPTILGVPDSIIRRGGFRFANTRDENPWTLLQETLPDVKIVIPTNGPLGRPSQTLTVPAVPALGDMNTLQFSLKKGIGDRIFVPSEEEPSAALQVQGMLDGSVFQGVVLVSQADFTRVFPAGEGFRYFLIEVQDQQQLDAVATLLETHLGPYGLDVERVSDRIAGFLAVQNTYLSTFQTLGGLGLLLGTLGLGTVMLRNIIERRSELALMRAVGYSGPKLIMLVLFENAVLVVCGLTIGSVCALVAMMPHLEKTGADVPWASLALTIAAVLAAGMTSAWLAAREAVRTPVLATLRGD